MEYGLHWFRRDLRVDGNEILWEQQKRYKGRVIGLFCFDRKFLSRPDFSHRRFHFFLNTLSCLQDELRRIGSDLLVLDKGPNEAFPFLMKHLASQNRPVPHSVSWNRDYEPFAKDRDQSIGNWLHKQSIPRREGCDHLIIEPEQLRKNDGGTYKVFTPFSRKWLEVFSTVDIYRKIDHFKCGQSYRSELQKGQYKRYFSLSWQDVLVPDHQIDDHLKSTLQINQKHVTIPIPESGSLKAFETLKTFKNKLRNYEEHRDIPVLEGTSNLSIFLKNGSLTSSQIIAYLKLSGAGDRGSFPYLRQLIWRDFYYHILHWHPNVEKEAFIPKFRHIVWQNRDDWFEKWKSGLTGYPLVDAGMRELKKTGHMHNRVRMVVASFLSKDLHIDWRWGERYFMEMLIDGDLAANNGGWQWSASTGCDPQPYFRVMNPWLQSKRFDPDGAYIKQHVPELINLPANKLHQPIMDHEFYPRPIVDHKLQRERSIAMYKSCDVKK